MQTSCPPPRCSLAQPPGRRIGLRPERSTRAKAGTAGDAGGAPGRPDPAALSFRDHDLITVTDAHTPDGRRHRARSGPKAWAPFTSTPQAAAQRVRREGPMTQFPEFNRGEGQKTSSPKRWSTCSGGLGRAAGASSTATRKSAVVIRTDWTVRGVALVSGAARGRARSIGLRRARDADRRGLRRCLRLAFGRCGAGGSLPSPGLRVACYRQELHRRPAELRPRRGTRARLRAERRHGDRGRRCRAADLPQARGVAGTLYVHKIAARWPRRGRSGRGDRNRPGGHRARPPPSACRSTPDRPRRAQGSAHSAGPGRTGPLASMARPGSSRSITTTRAPRCG